MSILLMIFWGQCLAAFICNITNHPIWSGINIAVAGVWALMTMAYEGRLINRIEKLEQEINDLKRRL